MATTHSNKRIDLIGKQFNRLTVLSYAGSDSNHRHKWECICTCGKAVIVRGDQMYNGNTKSCGCLKAEGFLKRITKHGKTNSRVYKIWEDMNSRCNGKIEHYKNYTEKKVTVADEWKSFPAFLKDMGEPPSNLHSIDRINNDLGYSRENCRWATMHEQSRNKSTNVFIELSGIRLCIADWSKRLILGHSTIQDRLNRGLTIKQALRPFTGKNIKKNLSASECESDCLR